MASTSTCRRACASSISTSGSCTSALGGLLWSKQFYHYEVNRWLKGDPAGPDGVHLVADVDFEGPVEHIPELVLAGVDVRRGPAAGGGQALKHREASTGARSGALSVNVSATNQIRSPSPAAVAKPLVLFMA